MPAPPATEYTEEGIPWYKFPPFPKPAPGKVIMPFKDFKPGGIKRPEYEDEDEIDAMGVPTVQLRVKHDNTKTRPSKKRKKGGAAKPPVAVPLGNGSPWYEQWAAMESLRPLYTRKSDRDTDELTEASVTFMKDRPWFNTTTLKLMDIYDHWRRYLGLVVPERKKTKGVVNGAIPGVEGDDGMAPEPDCSDDEEDDALPHNTRLPESVQEAQIEEIEEEEEEEPQNDLTVAFLDNPKLFVEKFFSSVYRAKGLATPPDTLRDGPIVLEYWFKYMIRSNVVSASKMQGLKDALEAVKLAAIELPITRSLSWAITDKLSDALRDTFGTRCVDKFEGNMQFTWNPPPQDMDAENDEADVKADAAPQDVTMAESDDIQELAASANINGGSTTLDPSHVQSPAGAGLWFDASSGGAKGTTGGWGTAGGWGVDDDEEDGAGGGGGGWDTGEGDTAAGWESKLTTVADLIGPEAATFAERYRTGIVERSTRRIKSVTPRPPINSVPDPTLPPELAKRYAQVVMAPWGTWVPESDTCDPEIRSMSEGPVVRRASSGNDAPSVGDEPGAHDPWKDDILFLVDPKVVEHLVVGMGIGGTWIQVVPEAEDQADDGKKKKKKKDAGAKQKPFWYLEQDKMVLTSFHVEE